MTVCSKQVSEGTSVCHPPSLTFLLSPAHKITVPSFSAPQTRLTLRHHHSPLSKPLFAQQPPPSDLLPATSAKQPPPSNRCPQDSSLWVRSRLWEIVSPPSPLPLQAPLLHRKPKFVLFCDNPFPPPNSARIPSPQTPLGRHLPGSQNSHSPSNPLVVSFL